MANPIKETPILYGKDSDRFILSAKKNEYLAGIITLEEYKQAKKLYGDDSD